MADRSGKSDMERVGLFQEMAYVTIGDRYVTKRHFFNEPAYKGKQMLPGGIKQNSALQHGYFDAKYSRVFEGEGYCDLVANRRRYRMEQKKRDVGKPFLPASGPKMPCGRGTYYGTIAGPMASFSPLLKTKQPEPRPNRNIFTNPPKQGGFGYANIGLSPYPAHSVDPFTSAHEKMQADIKLHKTLQKGSPFKLYLYPIDLFDSNPHKMDKSLPPVKKPKPVAKVDIKPFRPSSPGKKTGGGKFGTFDPYPTHSVDGYTERIKKPVNAVGSQKCYVPPAGAKSRPITSIVTQNFMRLMNVKNYRTMAPLTSLNTTD